MEERQRNPNAERNVKNNSLRRYGFLATVAATIVSMPLVLHGQVPAPPAFDVASIREDTGSFRAASRLTISGTLVSMEGYNIRWLVEEAYNLKGYQLSFAALRHRDDIDDVFYDVVARAPGEGVLTKEQFREMLRTLLLERFKLSLHHETKKTPVYALTLADNGAKLKTNTTVEKCFMRGFPAEGGQGYSFVGCDIGDLVRILSDGVVDRPVLDRTGLVGTFDFKFVAMPYIRSAHPGDISPFTAIRELGLKLEKQQAPIEMVVVDHVEKLSAN